MAFSRENLTAAAGLRIWGSAASPEPSPAILGWAIFAVFPSAVRRGIFVEPQAKIIFSPVGVASSVSIPDDVQMDLDSFSLPVLQIYQSYGLRRRLQKLSLFAHRPPEKAGAPEPATSPALD
jgi:hypothetical protein